MTDDNVENEYASKINEDDNSYLNPENILFDYNPVFVINRAPTARDLSLAIEKEVPVIVILSLKKFTSLSEYKLWCVLNVPDIDYIRVEWIGDHSFVHSIKNKWIKLLRISKDAQRKEQKEKFKNEQSKGKEVTVRFLNPNPMNNLFWSPPK